MFPKSMCNVRKICDTILFSSVAFSCGTDVTTFASQSKFSKIFDIFTSDKRKNTDFDINWLKMTFSPR